MSAEKKGGDPQVTTGEGQKKRDLYVTKIVIALVVLLLGAIIKSKYFSGGDTTSVSPSSGRPSVVSATRAAPMLQLVPGQRSVITGQAIGLWVTMYEDYTLRVWPKNGAMAEVVFMGDREVNTVEGGDPSRIANGRLIDKIRWLQEGVEVCIFPKGTIPSDECKKESER